MSETENWWTQVESLRNFRWIVRIPGLDPLFVQRVRSLPGRMIELKLLWNRMNQPKLPSEKDGTFSILHDDGTDAISGSFSWEESEFLPLDLDYGDDGLLCWRLLLKEVTIAWGEVADG